MSEIHLSLLTRGRAFEPPSMTNLKSLVMEKGPEREEKLWFIDQNGEIERSVMLNTVMVIGWVNLRTQQHHPTQVKIMDRDC